MNVCSGRVRSRAGVALVVVAGLTLVWGASASASVDAKNKPKNKAKTTQTTAKKGSAKGSVALTLTGAETGTIASTAPECQLSPSADGNVWQVKVSDPPFNGSFKLKSSGKLDARIFTDQNRIYGFGDSPAQSATLSGKTLTVSPLPLGLFAGPENPTGKYVTVSGTIVCP